MSASTPRKAKVNITYTPRGSGKSRTAAVMAEYEEGFTYTDPATGESDTLSLEVCNKDMRWAHRWLPKKGDKITAKIKVFSWDKAGKDQTFTCGKFCVDDLSFSGPELTATIGGVSSPDKQAFRCTERTKTWKNVTIKEIANKIGKKYGLKVVYDASVVKIGTAEQNGRTDSDFLTSLCEDYGLNVKVYFGKIVIYDAAKYERKKAVVAFHINDLQKWDYNTTITGTYTGATIKYTNGDNNKELTCKVGSGSRILNINEKVDSLSDAKLRARAKVNKENRSAVTMSATIRANLKITAGVCINIKGAYTINGKYFVDKVTHSIQPESGYTMDIEMHKVQDDVVKQKKDNSSSKTKSNSTKNSSEKSLSFSKGDRVTVNGNAYYSGNGGRSVRASGTYYITQVLGGSYKYQIGIAKRKGGTRYGWCSKEIVTKE